MNDHNLMNEAIQASERSPDKNTRVGAVIYNPQDNTVNFGWNSFPWGLKQKEERTQKPLKYSFTCHAEEAAISYRAKHGMATEGSSIFVTHVPCASCARLIVQSGIYRVVCAMQRTSTSDVDEPIAREILNECCVEFVEYE